MSMPPLARWEYNYQPDAESAQGKLYSYLVPQNWI